MPSLVLTRTDVIGLLDPLAVRHDLIAAFQAYSTKPRLEWMRVPAELHSGGSAMVLLPGRSEGIPAYSVKVHAKFPEHPPAIKGTLLLHDLDTGDLLAIMDSTYITAVRTGLSAAIATDLLARPEANTVAVIGAGVQGEFQLRYLSQLRSLERVLVYDLKPEQAQLFSQKMGAELAIEVIVADTLEACLSGADIVLTATWARQAFIFEDMLSEGAHITTLGPDQLGKSEVSAAVIENSLFICDDRELAVSMGAIGGAGLTQRSIHAELGEVLAGNKPGRTSSDQITVYGSVGLAFQDLVVGWHVYQQAKKQGVGHEISLLN